MQTYLLAFGWILGLGLVGLAVGPWWTLAAVAFAVGLALRPRRAGGMFAPGALAGAALWGGGALWFGLSAGELPGHVAELFGLGSGAGLAAVVCAVGAFTAGAFAVCGAYLRAVVRGPTPR